MARSWVSLTRKALRPVGSVDAIAAGRVVGWALGPGSLRIEAWLDGERVAKCATGQTRNDVAGAYPTKTAAGTSGFSLELPPGCLDGDNVTELQIVAVPTIPWLPSSTLKTVHVAGSGLLSALENIAPEDITSPFPQAVTSLVLARWPEDCSELETEAGQLRFVKRLKQLFATPGINALPVLADYAWYLRLTLAHCYFVEKHFPVTNARASAGAADFHCKPNSVRELFPIIHQLYVLRSYGVQGDFAEFGCFKGYSSAMLSFACQQLGVTMHVFDSFEGLPSSVGSGYTAGQYAGGLDEVQENVSRFGAVGSVQFHKGFFADTFRDWRPPPLMCLWMDVDLEVSARDLMVVADCLSPSGTIFSHECPPEVFQAGEVISPPHPDNPVAPMLERFLELGRPLTGQYVSGYTGAFWQRTRGIPTIYTAALFDLVSSFA